MTEENRIPVYLAPQGVANRVGLSVGTIRSYVHKGLMPPADILVDAGTNTLRAWKAETIDQWMANRPGRGARTDLR